MTLCDFSDGKLKPKAKMKLDTTSHKPRRLLIAWAIDGFTVPVKVRRTIDEIASEIRTLNLRTKPVRTYKPNAHLPEATR